MADAKAKDKVLTVVQFKSGIGYSAKQKQTLVGLGLNKINARRTLKDTPAIRGMINKVSHLVKVVETEEQA
jgi:large subunit ribosomal protein L30